MGMLQRLIDWCQRPSMIKVYKFQPINVVLVLASFSIIFSSVIVASAWRQAITTVPYPSRPYVTREEWIYIELANDGYGTSTHKIEYQVLIPNRKIPFLPARDLILNDQARPGLKFESSYIRGKAGGNVKYDSSTGQITVKIPKPTQPTYSISLEIEAQNVDRFVENIYPRTTCDPVKLNFNDETDLEITINPFKIKDLLDLRCVEIRAFITGAVEEYKYLGSEPEGYCSPYGYTTKWSHLSQLSSIGQHTVKYHVRIGPDDEKGKVVFFTDVLLWYDKPIYLTSKQPSINRNNFEFNDRGSCFAYQTKYDIG